MPELYDILSKGVLSLTGPRTLNIPTGSWVKLPFDVLVMDRGNGLAVDASANTITVSADGLFSAMVMLNCQFAKQEELMVTFAKNDTPYPEFLSEQGRGASKPLDFSYVGYDNLVNGDVITVVAQMEASDTDVEFLSGNFALQREQ